MAGGDRRCACLLLLRPRAAAAAAPAGVVVAVAVLLLLLLPWFVPSFLPSFLPFPLSLAHIQHITRQILQTRDPLGEKHRCVADRASNFTAVIL